MALIIAFTAIGVFFFRNEKLQSCREQKDSAVNKTALWTSLIISAVLSITIYVATRPLGSYGESTYLINRIELAARGLLPYRDFEFAYGAGFLYVPLGISRILHCSIPDGYYLFWVISQILGVWLLAVIVNCIDLPSRFRNQIFVLMFLASLQYELFAGLNYTFFRFMSVPLEPVMNLG